MIVISSIPSVQIETCEVKFSSAQADQDYNQPRKERASVIFGDAISHAVAIVNGYDAKYSDPTAYGQLKRTYFNVEAHVDDHDRRRVNVTAEWAWGPSAWTAYKSEGWIGVTVLGFTSPPPGS